MKIAAPSLAKKHKNVSETKIHKKKSHIIARNKLKLNFIFLIFI